MADEAKKELGYAFNYIADIGAGQQFQITGSFPKDVEEKTVHEEFKKFRNVAEYHRTWSGLRDLEAKVVEAERQVLNLEGTLEEIDKRQTDLKHIPNNEKIARDQTVGGLKHWKIELEQAKAILASRKKELE